MLYMIETCKGCNKQVPKLCCSAYADPSVLIWIRQGKPCPVNTLVDETAKKEKLINPIKKSKRGNK